MGRQRSEGDSIIELCHGLDRPDLQGVKKSLRPSPSPLYLDNIIKYILYKIKVRRKPRLLVVIDQGYEIFSTLNFSKYYLKNILKNNFFRTEKK